MVPERRLAVIDLGSNSFRLVVFAAAADDDEVLWWKRTDEIYESVRVGEGLDATGALQPEPMERALETVELFAHFCRATGIADVRAVATSAIREATNQGDFLRAAWERSGLHVQVLSREEEARYGYLAAVNSTTLADGVSLDLGGGSMQLTRVAGRRALEGRSWKLGAVFMTERFLAANGGRVKPKRLKALRTHVREELLAARWLAGSGGGGRRLVGIGGTVRNLTAAAMLAEGLPSFTVQGFVLTREALDALVERFSDMTAAERGRVPGIKPERGDLILAGATVIQTVMEHAGFDALEATEAGLREGVCFASLLGHEDPPLLGDVRGAAVLNLAAQYGTDFAHVEHVRRLAVEMWEALAVAGLHAADPPERELLEAAAVLHDVGTAIDYDDHHKHSKYLILNAGLPGFSPRETALIAQMARFHRKGNPSLQDLTPLMRSGDEDLLARCAAVLRLAEQLERSRDQIVRRARMTVSDDRAELRLEAEGDVTIARWAAERQGDVFARAFGRELAVVA
jgi:exopolyphosphatase/guanosine-5'-triphosphate,3'-diphosphate pyrophosphatase